VQIETSEILVFLFPVLIPFTPLSQSETRYAPPPPASITRLEKAAEENQDLRDRLNEKVHKNQVTAY
jgi:hypothetical protein